MDKKIDTGKIVADLPPQKGNPRNSEGSFIRLNDGSIMMVYSKFIGGTDHDDAPANLCKLISRDGGETWQDAGFVLKASEFGADNIMSVSLIRMKDGKIGMFYVNRQGFDNCKPYFCTSDDEGITWSKEKRCAAPAYGYYVLNNDRIIRTSSGRLIMPCGYHRTKTNVTSDIKDIRTIDFRAQTLFFFSDDDGISWNESNILTIPVRWSKAGLQEPGAVELMPGVIYGWSRTDAYCQYETFSFDDGATWTAPQPSVFRSPISPMTIKRDPLSGALLSFYNPIPEMPGLPGIEPGFGLARTPYVCSVSSDNAKSWSAPMVIESDPSTAYCYTAVHFMDGQMLIAYCAGSINEGYLNRLRIRKMPIPKFGC